jgi:hypothetical protein
LPKWSNAPCPELLLAAGFIYDEGLGSDIKSNRSTYGYGLGFSWGFICSC